MVEAKISSGKERYSSDNSGTSYVSAHQEESQRKKLKESSIDKVLGSFIEPLRDFLRKLAAALDTTCKIIINVSIIGLFIVFAFLIYAELNRDIVVLEAFEVPRALQEKGFTDRAIANRLKDQINLINETATTAGASRQFLATAPIDAESAGANFVGDMPPIDVKSTGTNDVGAMPSIDVKSAGANSIDIMAPIDVESAGYESRFDKVQIPGAGLSLGSILRFAKEVYGTPPTYITGEVTLHGDQDDQLLYLTVRAAGIMPSKEISGTLTDLDKTLLGAAEHIYKHLHPFTLAAYLQSKDEPERSVEIIQYTVHHNPPEDDPWAYNLWGIILADQGNYDEALAKYKKAMEKPRFAQPYYNRGIAYLNKGDYDLAIADFDQAIELGLDNASVYNIRGVAYAAQGELEAAIADYSRAIRPGPDNALDYFNRGNAYYAQGELDAAIAAYSQAITLDPQDASAYFNRGNAYYAQGKLEAAIAAYNQTIDLDPEYAAAYNNRGLAYAAQGEQEAAFANFKKATDLDPQDALAYNNICWWGSLEGNAAQVMGTCERAVALALDHGGIRDSRGLARALRGDYDGAIADFTFAVAWMKASGTPESSILKREYWIKELNAGRNPFDSATLAELRNE